MAGQMYFGNRNRMTWVKCPDSGMGLTRARWSAEGVYLNGGGYVRESTASHIVYEMGWNFLNRAQLYAITDYRDGVYGPGNIYFLDPFQMDRNVLPQNWAQPAIEDGQPLTDERPSVQTMTTDTTNYNPDPRATAVGALWGYQAGTGETAATSLMTASTPKRTNLATDPRATDASRWFGSFGTGGAGTETMVASATDGPLLPDGTRATGYARYTYTAANTGGNSIFGYNSVIPGSNVYPSGTTAGLAIYVRSSRAAPGAVRLYGRGLTAANTQTDPSYSPTFADAPAGQWVRVGMVHTVTSAVGDWLPYAHFSNVLFQVGDTVDVVCAMTEPGATEVGAYFDGSTLGAAGIVNAWTGAVNASPSTQTFNDGPVLPDGSRIGTYVRRTVTTPKTAGSSGPWSRVPTGTYALSAGDQVSPTMHVRFSVPVTITVQSTARNASAGAGSVNVANVAVPANTWTRIGNVVTATGAADNTQVWAVLAAGTILPVGTTVDTTGGQSERGAVTPYLDGSLADTRLYDYAWLGAANASASIRRAQTNPLRNLDAPTQSATYTLTGDTEFQTVWVPVPDGYTFHVGGLYARTGTANVKVVTDNEVTTELVPDMNPAVHVIPATAISNTGGGVTLSLTGTGTITLVGLMAQVLPNGRVPTANTFMSGQGTSGSKFVGDPSINGYSAVRDHLALSVRLKETGAWDE